MLFFQLGYTGRLSVAIALAVVAAARLGAQDIPQANSVEKVTLQYRVARDAFAPSRFIAVIGDGVSPPLELVWDLHQTAAHEKKKAQFDDLIRSLEAKQINGVEFECRAEWIQYGAKLRITTVPELSASGTKRIQDRSR
jgi:hypothetical protein